MPDQPLHQVDAGDGAGHVGALGQVGRGGIELLQPQLVGHAVFVEDIGHPFDFAGRRGEKGHPVAALPPACGPRRWPPACCRERSCEGRVAMCRPADSHRAPADLQFLRATAAGDAAACRSQILPAEVRSARDRRPASVRSAPAASRSAPPRRGPAPVRPTPRPDGPAARRPRHVARPDHGRQQFPARERLAGRRQVAARDVRLAHQLAQFHQQSRAISGIPSAVVAVQSSIFSTDRCDSTSKRRIDSTWSPNRSMRTGLAASGENTSRMPPRTRVLAHHFHRLAPLVADAFQVGHHLVQRQFVADLQSAGPAGGNSRRARCAAARRPPAGW